VILSLLWGEVCWISGSFGAMNGIEETYSRSQPVLDSFLSLVLQFSAMIEGKVESNLSAQPAKAKTKFLFFESSKAHRESEITASEEFILMPNY